MTKSYDLLVIGAGAAGSAAAHAAPRGARVIQVERDRIGGTCLNYGCDPTKTLLHIAQELYRARHSEQFGLSLPLFSIPYKTGRLAFKSIERALTMGQTEGLIKLLVDEQGHILGGHILGARADDLLASLGPGYAQ
jgi:pyruvate/2-oxoglutarate dehydrogenase complex dihydrolipoamide dehydrogenase (E3) component